MSAMRPPVIDLLCLPCAGASATMYLRWRRLLPEWIRVVPVELPGRGSRLGEPFVENFDALVARLTDEVAQLAGSRWALFGHSMGALLAYGVVRRLQRASMPPPQVLFVSGSPAPSRRDPDRFAGKDDDVALIADLRKQGGTPDEVFENPELLRITLDTLGADYRLCESFAYRPGTPFHMPMHAFGGRDDDIERERLEAWQAEAGGPFSLHWFDGGHFFIRHHEKSVLQAVVGSLLQHLAGGRHAGAVLA
ncbi:MAG: thioesterase II family protein [Rhodocyclaceae bacterium]